MNRISASLFRLVSLFTLASLGACSSAAATSSKAPEPLCTVENTAGMYAVTLTPFQSSASSVLCPAVRSPAWGLGGGGTNVMPPGSTLALGTGDVDAKCRQRFAWTRPASAAPCATSRAEGGTLDVTYAPDTHTFAGVYTVAACPETIGGDVGSAFCEGDYLVKGTLEP